MPFLFLCNVWKRSKSQIEEMTSTDTVFEQYVCPKQIYQPENWHARCPGVVLQHIVHFFENFENFGFWKGLYKICFFMLG